MYHQIQKADRPAIRDTDHPFSVRNHKKIRKTDQQKKKFTLLQLYMHQLRAQLRLDPLRDWHWHNLLNSLALVGSNKGTRPSWIHKSGQRLLDPLSSDWITERISTGEINHTMLMQHLNIVISANCN